MELSTQLRLVVLASLVLIFTTLTAGVDIPIEDLYKKPGDFQKVAAAPGKTRFTEEEKQLILQIHNSYRSVVQPPAADMRELIWDDDLEEFMVNHTQDCTGAHSGRNMVKKYRVDDPGTWVTWDLMGENLYYSFAPEYSIQEALYLFWAEGAHYDITTHTCTDAVTCAHYRVMVSADSSRIGCALNTCESLSESTYPTPAVFIGCEYDGMFLTAARPYTVGERGSYCNREQMGYSFQFLRNGMCVTPRLHYTETGFDGNISVAFPE